MEEKEITMEIINPKAAGIDIGSRSHTNGISQKSKNAMNLLPKEF